MHRLSIILAVVLLVLPIAARSLTIAPGVDLLQTRATPAWDFSGDPIPADFFGPGSDPFDGIITFNGDPFTTSPWAPPTELGLADLIIRRPGSINLPSVPSSDTVPIELVQLSLVSVNPITVTYNGGLTPEPWDVHFDLSPTPSGAGSMTITRNFTDGGTFSSVLPVTPMFTFTRQSDSAVRQLDGALSGHTDLWQANGVQWQSPAPNAGCSDFAESFFDIALLSQFNGSTSVAPFTNGCLPTSVPTLSEWASIVLVAALMLVASAVLLRRRLADA